MVVNPLNSHKEFTDAINSGKLVFVDFYADWCQPCKAISPEFERLAGTLADNENVGFYKVNIDNVEQVAQEVGISSIPTFHLFHNGQKLDQVVGANKGALGTLVTNGIARIASA